MFCFQKMFGFGWGALSPRPIEFLLGGDPRPPPLNGRSSHLIEAAKRGRLDHFCFFSAPLTTRAPLERLAGRLAERPAGRAAKRPAERPAERLASRVSSVSRKR